MKISFPLTEGKAKDSDKAMLPKLKMALTELLQRREFKRFPFIKINKNGCWEWKKKNSQGYGTVSLNGKLQSAHRYFYEAIKGEIPQGLTLDHLCRNRICCNPNHLEAVTLGVNTLRGESPSAKNKRKKFCKRGHPLSGENLLFCVSGNKKNRICRTCKQTRYLEYREKNNKKIKEYHKNYFETNREKIQKYKNEWARKHYDPLKRKERTKLETMKRREKRND